MGTEKNAEQRSIDEKKRLERERWEREMRERERREAEEEWEAERRRAADWERAKEAILAGPAVFECNWGSYGPCTGVEPTGGDFVVAPGKRTCRLRITAWAWKKPLWSKTTRMSKEEVERLRTLVASIVLPERKYKPQGVASGCDGGFDNWCVCVGDETLCSLCGFDTLRLPYGSAKWKAEEAAERKAFAPLLEMLDEFWKKAEKCKPASGS